MSTVKRKCHLKALSENLELGLIAGVLSCGVDTFWCVMEALHDGLTIHRSIIITVLLFSTLILTVALVRHHRNNVKQEIGALIMLKKNVLKCKNRHHRK